MEASCNTITDDACKLVANHIGFPTDGAKANGIHKPLLRANGTTLGHHVARGLVEIGIKNVFTVPGDFNLTLLDYLVAEPEPNLIGCCNELNAGYARYKGVGACVVTFNVGGLGILNAIAGAYSEDLPIICIVGGPNSNDYGSNRILHHSIGLPDFSQELLNYLDDAHERIDTAIATALRESKPVYISIACNLSGIPHHSFIDQPVPFYLTPRLTNKRCLEIAVEGTSEFLNKAVKPVMVGGPRFQTVLQMTAQEVSTMLRCGQNGIIFLINSGGYTTEVEIHYGPYNVVKNWNYVGQVETIDNGQGKCWTAKVHCEEELIEAIQIAMESKNN
ncbi:Pyruvate decarboxylase 1 [Spatholobus suberectus]|nr:Pyruvate decarboxylase 1 [Spatholobus suberectus]